MGETRPGGRIASFPPEHQESHGGVRSRSEKNNPAQLSDAQIERDFLDSFTPPSVPVSLPEIQPTIERVIGKPTKPEAVAQYTLPPGTIIYDEDGKEIDRLTKPTLANVSKIDRPGRNGGPAPSFRFESAFPLGNENKDKRVNGIVRRKGKLWYGQTTADLKK